MFDDDISERLYEHFNYDGIAFGFKFRDDKKHLCINAKEVGISWLRIDDVPMDKKHKKEVEDAVFDALVQEVKPFVDKIKKEMKIDGER